MQLLRNLTMLIYVIHRYNIDARLLSFVRVKLAKETWKCGVPLVRQLDFTPGLYFFL